MSQIKATDHGSPSKTSKSRLDVEWLPPPEPSLVSLAFDEEHFTFAVMETDPVTHMVGIISTEIPQGLLWFNIIGEYTATFSSWLALVTLNKTAWHQHRTVFHLL